MQRPLMTWNTESKRWYKKFLIPGTKKYKIFCVSAKALSKLTGCEPSKTGSLLAANSWWRQREAELSLAAKGTAAQQADAVAVAISARLRLDAAAAVQIGNADAARLLLQAADEVQRRRVSAEALPEFDLDSGKFITNTEPTPKERLEQELHDVVRSAKAVLHLDKVPQPQPRVQVRDATLRCAITDYLAARMVDVKAGNLSKGRYSWLSLTLDRLANFAGDKSKLSDFGEQELAAYRDHLLSKFAPLHSQDCLSTTRQFLRWCWETKRISELPRNLASKSLLIRVPRSTPASFSVDQLQLMLQHSSPRMRLYILLALNAGLTQCDIANIKPSEFDPVAGTLTRRRTKMAHCDSTPIVRYALWPITVELLQQFKSNDPEHLLLNEDGRVLKTEKLSESGKLIRVDNISLAYRRFMKGLAKKGILETDLPFKVLRKTGANLIRAEYGLEYSSLYLGHSAQTLQDRSYTSHSQARFDKAVCELGIQIGVVTVDPAPSTTPSTPSATT